VSSKGHFASFDVPLAALPQANLINEDGQIAGLTPARTARPTDSSQGCASFTTIDSPGAACPPAWGINSAAQIVGTHLDTVGPQTAALSHDGGNRNIDRAERHDREKDQAMNEAFQASTPALFALFLAAASVVHSNGQTKAAPHPSTSIASIQNREAYVMRDGLRIYLWEKYREDQEQPFASTGKVALLVHGGTRSGRSLYDLQIRDYSLMDFLAQNGYDVWAIDSHGYGHSDKTAKDWVDSHSAAADIAAAVEHITKLRGVSKINLLGGSAGTQRVGVFAMEHPEKVGKLVLYAGFWKGTAEFREFNRKRMKNGGQPLSP